MRLVWLVVVLSFSVSTHALHYMDLEMLGVESCPLQNSCLQMGNAHTVDRICECDPSCATFGDCCIDARRPPRVRQQLTPPRQTCMPHGNKSFEGAYAISSCPPTTPDVTPEIRRMCQNNNFSDPLLSAPVTDTLNRKTYLNRYCAFCNAASESSLKTWTISACKMEQPRLRNVTWSDLVEQSGTWGLVSSSGEFQQCQFQFSIPEGVSGLRSCRSNLVSTCSSAWRRPHYVRGCEEYQSMVVDDRGVAYRNPHCAICNGVDVGHIFCFNEGVVQRKGKPFSFALLLDVNRSDGDIVGISQRCPSGQKFDPFFNKCRALVCAIPGYTMVNGRCTPR